MDYRRKGKKSALIIAHPGIYHADDCFSCAVVRKVLLRMGYDDIQIMRIRDERKIEELMKLPDVLVFVLDVGNVYDLNNNQFDHHQRGDAGRRKNGIPYATFGLVWMYFSDFLCDTRANVARIVDNSLIQQVDAEDNGFSLWEKTTDATPFTISQLFSLFRPTWLEIGDCEEEEILYESFLKAVEYAENILDRAIAKAVASDESLRIVNEAFDSSDGGDPRILVLSRDCQWQAYVSSRSSSTLYVIYPYSKDRWAVKAVPTMKNKSNFFEVRKPFPDCWRIGNNPGILRITTRVPDALFCHIKGFMATASSKEGALQLAKLAADA